MERDCLRKTQLFQWQNFEIVLALWNFELSVRYRNDIEISIIVIRTFTENCALFLKYENIFIHSFSSIKPQLLLNIKFIVKEVCILQWSEVNTQSPVRSCNQHSVIYDSSTLKLLLFKSFPNIILVYIFFIVRSTMDRKIKSFSIL